MAIDSITLLPSLRPWQRAGVEFLLAEQALPAPWSLCIAAAPGALQQHTAPRTQRPAHVPEQEAAPHRRPVQTPASAGSAAAVEHSAPRTLARSASGATPSAGSTALPGTTISSGVVSSGSGAAPQTAAKPSAVPDLAPALWPGPWQERLKKTAPAAVLWTYWTLGEDLCVRPNPARRALLQRLLADLAHPAGTHSFWPPALPFADSDSAVDCELQANPEVFWSGVQALKARALVVMGSPAIKALELPPRLRPFQQTRHNGRLIVVLRDVDFLAQETHRYDAVREFLKQALAPFGR